MFGGISENRKDICVPNFELFSYIIRVFKNKTRLYLLIFKERNYTALNRSQYTTFQCTE